MAKILIIDDDRMICETLSHIFSLNNHEVGTALTLKEGIKKCNLCNYDVVFLDVRMPDGDGLAHLPEIKAAPSSPEVIIITGHGDPDKAEKAIRNKVWAIIRKPASLDEVTLVLNRALQYRLQKSRNGATKTLKRCGIIGNSPAIHQCLEMVTHAADTQSNILITGETGHPSGNAPFLWPPARRRHPVPNRQRGFASLCLPAEGKF